MSEERNDLILGESDTQSLSDWKKKYLREEEQFEEQWEESHSEEGEGGSSKGSGGDTIYVIDAMAFISALKERKRKLRTTYVESKKKGAKLFRYIDYASLMNILAESVISVKIEDIEVNDVPTVLEHTFEVEDVEIDPEDGGDDEEGEGGEGGYDGGGSGSSSESSVKQWYDRYKRENDQFENDWNNSHPGETSNENERFEDDWDNSH